MAVGPVTQLHVANIQKRFGNIKDLRCRCRSLVCLDQDDECVKDSKVKIKALRLTIKAMVECRGDLKRKRYQRID